MDVMGFVEKVIEYVEEVDVDGGTDYLLALSKEQGNNLVVHDVINAFLRVIGERWEQEKGFSFTDTYVASKIVKQYLENMIVEKTEHLPNRRAIMGNIKNDFQSTGRDLVVRYLELDGWEVINLGNDVEPETFVEVALKEKIDFVGVSAMLYENALHIKELVELIEEKCGEEKPYLIVGGAVFNLAPNLIKEISIEYTAANAYEARELFDQLYKEKMNG